MNRNQEILRIAVPAIVSNITVPLLGLVDVAITGHLGAAAYIGAIAVGGMLFSLIYWLFGFLRMGTSGMTSQAYGKGDAVEQTRILICSTATGLAVTTVLVAFQYPIGRIAFAFIHPTPEVERLASTYFRICIWGAPAVLLLYSLCGWFIGMQNSRYPMYIAVVQNLGNIAVSLWLVHKLGLKIEGVALGTLTAQYIGLLLAVVLWLHRYGYLRSCMNCHALTDRRALGQFFHVNRDIFLRTVCLVAVTVSFTSIGAARGEMTLAVNTLLMQLFTLFSYVMDGFAYAGEALAGKHIGTGDRKAFRSTVRNLFGWGAGLAMGFTLLYGLGGQTFLSLLTDNTEVVHVATRYFGWVLAVPAVGFTAFLLDGVFIGATATSLMLKSMLVASVAFFLLYICLGGTIDNHALWLAFDSYLFLRGAMQLFLGRRLLFSVTNH